MRAVEDLLNEVHDRESRRYLGEAIGSYQAGAFRAAIVATWVAVAFDLIGKIRQLDDAGDPTAGAFMRGLERAIENQAQNLRDLRIQFLCRFRVFADNCWHGFRNGITLKRTLPGDHFIKDRAK